MRRNSLFFGLLALSILVWSPYDVAADWWKDESGKGKREYAYKEEYKRTQHGYKYKWQDGNCKYEYKTDKHGYKEKRKCKGGAHYTGGPPPWAPAHGYRAHQRGGYQGGTQTAYVPPYDVRAGLEHFGEVDLDHDGIHHEEQAQRDGDRDHRCAADVERDGVER